MNPDYVKERFVEAAQTERMLPPSREKPNPARSLWPDVVLTPADIAGWGAERYQDQRAEDFARVRVRPTAAQISRWEEVLDWCIRHVDRDEHRTMVKVWAACQVSNRSFAKYCRGLGLARSTAYKRLDSIFEKIGDAIGNDCQWLLDVRGLEGGQVASGSGIPDATLDDLAASPRHWMADGAKPADLIETDADAEALASHIEAMNERRRREQMRRAKLAAAAP